MHIPDGYLSPSTCVSLFGAAAPFWLVALKRVKRMLNTRMIPLLSVFAAFTFVIMMFNLPLPGGTTGHAVGMGVASIVLGPWASIVAISVALVIQAVFFGDGGITAIGANCFNMAIVGSLVAYAAYRARRPRSIHRFGAASVQRRPGRLRRPSIWRPFARPSNSGFSRFCSTTPPVRRSTRPTASTFPFPPW